MPSVTRVVARRGRACCCGRAWPGCWPGSATRWSPPSATPDAAGRGRASTAPTWSSPTSGCRRASPTRGCGPPSRCAPRDPASPSLVLSQYVEQTYAADLLDSGDGAASATCSRTGSATSRSSSTRCAGSPAAGPSSTRRWSASCCAAAATRCAALSAREREVLALMAEGRSNAAIARRLVVSRGGGRQARRQHPRQARPAPRRRRPPPGTRGPHLSTRVRPPLDPANTGSFAPGRRWR